jgi:hypothetical protein
MTSPDVVAPGLIRVHRLYSRARTHSRNPLQARRALVFENLHEGEVHACRRTWGVFVYHLPPFSRRWLVILDESVPEPEFRGPAEVHPMTWPAQPPLILLRSASLVIVTVPVGRAHETDRRIAPARKATVFENLFITEPPLILRMISKCGITNACFGLNI